MDRGDFTAAIAVYGALIGSVAFLWRVYEWFDKRRSDHNEKLARQRQAEGESKESVSGEPELLCWFSRNWTSPIGLLASKGATIG
jgi:hypothetical protein